ncbi:MAG: serine hydrolase domain-containing protein [Ekhidna sp.]
MRAFKNIALIVLIMLIWSAFIGYGFIDGFLLKPIASDETVEAFLTAAKKKIDSEYVGNLGMSIIENGEVVETYFHSSDDKTVNGNSAFPVASISKWVTAVGVLKLVDQGLLDLDRPVDDYLTRWHLPASEFDNNQVTVRRLLSHSAGLVDDLGYGGFSKDEEIQSLEASLYKAADGDYSEGIARVGYEPGSQFMYSGASYTLLQLIVEEVTNQPFSDYMTAEVLQPLGMNTSSYALSDSTKIGLLPVYQTDGTTRPMNRFTAKAAASLMTSISDLSSFMLAHIHGNQLLSSNMVNMMSQPTSYRNGVPYYGLGPKLFSQDRTNSNIIGHDGSGNNAINTAARVDLQSKSGIIVLETGNWDIASSIADEWLFWKADIADYVVMQRNKSYLLTLLLVGYGFIIVFSLFIMRKGKVSHS